MLCRTNRHKHVKRWWRDGSTTMQRKSATALVQRQAQPLSWPLTCSGTSRQGQAHSQWCEASMSRLSHTACVHHTDEGEGHHYLPAKQLRVGDLGGHNRGVETACSRNESAQPHGGWLGTVHACAVHYLSCGPCLTLPAVLVQAWEVKWVVATDGYQP
jgi:hypothetical protein